MTELIIIFTMICFAAPLYVYVGYPCLLFILTKILPGRSVETGNIHPHVAVFISCYNEENVIEKKIQNCLQLKYPADKIEFIFVSDGSDDNTDQLVLNSGDDRIKLVRQEGRLGKTCGLNLAIPQTRAEIAVFSDANAMYSSNAVEKLVRNFNDPQVGYVVGAALYTDGNQSAAANSEDTYWRYEMAIKKMETQLHSVVGGDGAIYAIRKELYEPLDREDINDFVNPLQIIAKGYRGIFEPEAKCFEETAGDFDKEGRRKERIVNRSFRGLLKVKEVMNPRRTGLFSFLVISHKLLRWLIPFFILFFSLGSLALSMSGIYLFHIIVLFGSIVLWMAYLGSLKTLKKPPAFLYYTYYFFLVNFKSAAGVIAALRGNIQVTWNTHRSETSDSSSHRTNFLTNQLLTLTSLIALTAYALIMLLRG